MRPPRRSRTGMVLPLVLIVMLVVLAMAAALQLAGWRAARGARVHYDAQRALYLAEAAIVREMSMWARDSVAATAIGVPRVRDALASNGWHTRVSITRTGPLTAIAHAVASYTRDRSGGLPVAGMLSDASGVRRTVTRALRLEPPKMPVSAAATVLGPIIWDAAILDGRDQLGPFSAARDDCGPWRDTSSVAAAIVATQMTASGGAPPITSGAVLQAAPTTLAGLHSAFDTAWSVVRTRAHTVAVTPAGALPMQLPWRAGVTTGAGVVTLTAPTVFVGLLAIDGDLHVRSALRVEGVLVVRGALVADSGALQVNGALVVRDTSARGSALGRAADIRYNSCLAARAFAAVATPVHAPFALWNSP